MLVYCSDLNNWIPNTIEIQLLDEGRTDKFYTLTARISHVFLQRGTISAFYQYGECNSTFPGYSFSSNQFGGEVSYSF